MLRTRPARRTRLRLGNDVLLVITQYTQPCYKLEKFFKEGQILRMAQEEHPGWARVYARVLSAGEIRIGDTIQLER